MYRSYIDIDTCRYSINATNLSLCNIYTCTEHSPDIEGWCRNDISFRTTRMDDITRHYTHLTKGEWDVGDDYLSVIQNTVQRTDPWSDQNYPKPPRRDKLLTRWIHLHPQELLLLLEGNEQGREGGRGLALLELKGQDSVCNRHAHI